MVLPPPEVRRIETYFDSFLPAFLGKQLIAGLVSLSCRFWLEIAQCTSWTLEIDQGRLVRIGSGHDGTFGYRVQPATFLAVVAGLLPPQQGFFQGDISLEGNTLEDLRYGLHYMFANNSQVIGNLTRRTRTGYALMQSRNLTVIGNRSEQDENYGILMNYITYSTITDNFVSDVRNGSTGGDSMISGAEGKALFIYNSLFNTIERNRFANSALGIHLTAGSEDNRIAGNAFVGNQQQVKYVATRTQEWSVDGRGNYWSDYLGWDRNDDGLGDVPYEPNDNVDRLLWTYPQVRLLMNSPGIELLRWVQRVFPVIKSPGVQDSHPLMALPGQPPMAPPQEPTS